MKDAIRMAWNSGAFVTCEAFHVDLDEDRPWIPYETHGGAALGLRSRGDRATPRSFSAKFGGGQRVAHSPDLRPGYTRNRGRWYFRVLPKVGRARRSAACSWDVHQDATRRFAHVPFWGARTFGPLPPQPVGTVRGSPVPSVPKKGAPMTYHQSWDAEDLCSAPVFRGLTSCGKLVTKEEISGEWRNKLNCPECINPYTEECKIARARSLRRYLRKMKPQRPLTTVEMCDLGLDPGEQDVRVKGGWRYATLPELLKLSEERLP